MIWARELPRVRSSPNSRVRCATVIEKVLKMMNAPTTSATYANTSRNVRMKLRLASRSEVSLAACSLPVRTSTVAGSSEGLPSAELREADDRVAGDRGRGCDQHLLPEFQPGAVGRRFIDRDLAGVHREVGLDRSEERRVGKEGRSRRAAD